MSIAQEMKERIEANRRAAFHGRRYWYQTREGLRQIGVFQGLGGNIWIVGWFRENGARRAVKLVRLKASDDPARLQLKLDQWAAERGLQEVSE